MRTYRFICVFLVFSIASLTAYARVAPQNTHPSSLTDEDCSMSTKNSNSNTLRELSCTLDPERCIHKAGWDIDQGGLRELEDRQDEEVVDAMALLFSNGSRTQGVQVCEGVYLFSNHGLYGSRGENEVKGGEGLSMEDFHKKYATSVASFPLGSDFAKITDIQGPCVNSSTCEAKNDFVFVTLDKSFSDSVVKPISATPKEWGDSNVQAEIYRPRIATNATGVMTNSRGENVEVPDYESGTYEFGSDQEAIDFYSDIYKSRCELIHYSKEDGLAYYMEQNFGSQFDTELLGHNCPTENTISGSPIVVRDRNNQPRLSTIIKGGARKNVDSGADPNASTLGVSPSSDSICKTYERVCGSPCETMSDLDSTSL